MSYQAALLASSTVTGLSQPSEVTVLAALVEELDETFTDEEEFNVHRLTNEDKLLIEETGELSPNSMVPLSAGCTVNAMSPAGSVCPIDYGCFCRPLPTCHLSTRCLVRYSFVKLESSTPYHQLTRFSSVELPVGSVTFL